jgi:hypothetical protein
MKQFALYSLAITLFNIFAVSASAAPYHLTRISWIVATRNNLDVDDRYVTIVGHVTRRIGDDEYWFTDGTGSVRLDSENFDLPVGPRLIVGGRIDQAWLGIGHLEVDVRRWRYAPAHHPAAIKTTTVTAKAETASAPATKPAADAAPGTSAAPATPPLAPPQDKH